MKRMNLLNPTVLGLSALLLLGACASDHKPSNHPRMTETSVDSERDLERAAEVEYDRVPASECDSSKYKECKEARKSDVATRYMLGHNGTLYRKINSATCAVTEGVEDFKISQHPKDVAAIYFKKGGHLYLLNVDKEFRAAGNCPSSQGNTKRLMDNVEKFTVTSNVNTTIVNAALGTNGEFKAWDNNVVVYSDSNVAEFQMNTCFGTAGKSFSSYVLFTRGHDKSVTKVKVTEGKHIKDISSVDASKFEALADFKKKMKVCK
ncbi:MAG TPA: hypothetical protein VNJ01_08730 [Bacteriovoracaceae bacterium]|nr:hypothetical protein [Bacteriovoracaceae bacterium]